MKRRDALLALVAELSQASGLGRTSLQKAAYFLETRRSVGFGHSAHYYGPFSPTVEAEVGALVTAGLLEESEHSLGFRGKGGFEARRFSYSVTEDGNRRLQSIRSAYPDEADQIQKFADDLLSQSPELDQRLLSAAAKVHYIEEREGQGLSPSEVTEIARQFSWDISEFRVSQVRELSRLLAQANQD